MMLRLSRTGIKELTRQYKSVLKKCFLINLGVFALSAPAMAVDVSTYSELETEVTSTLQSATKEITLTSDITATENFPKPHSGSSLISNATVNIDGQNHVLDMSSFEGFSIKQSSAVLGLNNLTLQNANSTQSNDYPSAVYISGTGRTLNLNNSIIKNNTHSYSEAAGGAFFIKGNLNSSNTLYEANQAVATNQAHGGAIHIENGSASFTSDTFKNNIAQSSGSSEVDGGAIYTKKNVTISGTSFENNGAVANTGSAFGGAIYSAGGVLTLTNTSLTGNYATTNASSSTKALGGAIYTNKALTIKADGATSLIAGNYTSANGTVDDNAIYMASNSSSNKLTFDVSNGGSIVLKDNVKGVAGYTVNINGADKATDTLYLYNNIHDAKITTSNITINTQETAYDSGATVAYTEYNLGQTLATDSSTNWAIDFDPATLSVDSFNVTGASSGQKMVLSDINYTSDITELEDGDTTVQILKTGNDNIQLELGDSIQTEFEDTVEDSGTDEITSTVNWSDEFGAWTKTDTVSVDLLLTKSTNGTTNDSLLFTKSTVEGTKTYTTDNDTLALLNVMNTTDERQFNATSATEEYTLKEDLTATSAGTLTINGQTEGTNTSVLDADNHELFTISNGTTLNVNNTKIENAKTAAVTNNGGSVALQNVTLSSKGTNDVVNAGTLTLSGTNSFDKGLKNEAAGQTTNSGTLTANVTNEGTITNTGTIEGILTSSSGSIENNGTLNLKGTSTIANVTGSGSIEILDGATTVNSSVAQSTLLIDSGAAVSDLSNALTLSSGITNKGTLNLGGGTNVNAISGDGNGVINLASGLDLGTSSISQNSINLSGGSLIFGSSSNVDNTVNLTAESGSTVNITDYTVNAKDVTFKSGSTYEVKLTDADHYGSLNANAITVENGANLSATLGQGLAKIGEVKDYQLLTSATTTDFNNFADSFDNNMYHFEKSGKNGLYKVSLVETAEDVAAQNGANGTAREAASAWVDGDEFTGEDKVTADALADLAQNDGKGFVKALSTLVPYEAPVVSIVSTHQNDTLMDALDNHLRFSNHDKLGISSGDELRGINVWMKVYTGGADLKNSGSVQGFDMKGNGVVAAIEKEVFPAFKVGIGGQYDETSIHAHRRGIDVDTATGFVYAEYKPSDWYVNSMFAYSRAKYDENKYVLSQKHQAHYDADTYATQLLTGYNVHYKKSVISPQIGLRYYRIERDGYKDTLNQRVASADLSILRSVAGVKASTQFKASNNWIIRPQAYAGITYDIVSDEDKANVALSNGSQYTVYGKRLHRLGFEVGTDLTAEVTDQLSLNVLYMGSFREKYQTHTGLLGMKYKF